MSEVNSLLTDSEKVCFNSHMNDVQNVVYEKLKSLGAEEIRRLRNIDIFQEGRKLLQDMDEMFRRNVCCRFLKSFMLDGIYRIMAAYYVIYSENYPVRQIYREFMQCKNIMLHLDQIRKDLLGLEPESTYGTDPILKEYNARHKQYTRMSKLQFHFLLDTVGPSIEQSGTQDYVISAATMLLLTLHYLSSGDTFTTIAGFYLIELSTVSQVIQKTTDAIWDKLQELYIFFPFDWEAESEQWTNLHGLPHCVGAMDGKHIRIQKPANTEHLYLNHKQYYSIVLIGICDVEYNFIYASIGAPGALSDTDIWNGIELSSCLAEDDIDFPADKLLPNSNINFGYFFVGDSAFPMSKNVLRKYNGRNLSADKAYFNERLSNAKNTIEKSFAMLSSRFGVFRNELAVEPEFATSVAKCCVVLHNYIQKTSDNETPNIEYCEADVSFGDQQGIGGRSSNEANLIRDKYKDYLFN